jgi:hypothetical protein
MEMVQRARARHADLEFVHAEAHAFELEGTFDAIILSDLVNELWDVQHVLERRRRHSHDRTRIILNTYSRVWEWPLWLTKALRLAMPTLRQNWFTKEDLGGLLQLAGFEVIRTWTEILLPLPVPLLAPLANRVLVRLWPLRHLALTNFIVARPIPAMAPSHQQPTVSVIIAARNEAGHIKDLIERVPSMGGGTEIVFVEGHSSDDTFATIEREIAAHPDKACRLFRQSGEGKGDAVRLGFERACGDILMILDADITVPPEDLPRFYEALHSGKAEFVNGVRLVYPMEDEAMRGANFLGNKFFSLAFSWLLGQPIKDTLCGTKVLRKTDYERIAAGRQYFGRLDPFGDFDLIFGAAKAQLKILDLPIRYRQRRYGTTNIQRWRHGWLLLRMVVLAARRLKFV